MGVGDRSPLARLVPVIKKNGLLFRGHNFPGWHFQMPDREVIFLPYMKDILHILTWYLSGSFEAAQSLYADDRAGFYPAFP